MSKKLTIDETIAWLEERDNFLILTHIRPDGDTLGCAGGLAQGLRDFGKTAYVLFNAEATARYGRYAEEYWAVQGYSPEHVVAVDTATLDLIPESAFAYKDRIELCIDHHGSNSMYAENVCCLPDYAACGEIIYEIIAKLLGKKGKKVCKKAADSLYVAVSTDTGCFCYRNTTANTHRVAAELIELGASSVDINKQIFRTKRRERIIIEGMVNTGIEFYFDGKVAINTITIDMMKTAGANADDIDDISNIPSSIEGVFIGITIREMSCETDCKISVRTSPPFDASEICKKFGGGGHKAAAGATVEKSAVDAKADLLAAVEGYFN